MGMSISIVIPCYNADSTIVRCLDSIFASSEREVDVECILIDDKSKDNTAEIVNRYIEEHTKYKIKFIRNAENLGAGETRNIGIKVASKEYIMFVDADDQIDSRFFEEISKTLKQENLDCIIFNALFCSKGKQKTIPMLICRGMSSGTITNSIGLAYTKGSTWGKVYRTSIIKENQVKFASLKRNEDLVFTKIAISYCKDIYYLNKPLYIYNDVETSLMHNASLLDEHNAFRAFDSISKSLINRGFVKELNLIYLIEVVYATTMTLIRKESSHEELVEHFDRFYAKYSKEDEYYKYLSNKYKTMILLMRLHLFSIIRIL